MYNRILRFRLLIVVLAIGLSIPFALEISNLTRDAGISALVPKTHPAYEFSDFVEEQFGAVDQIVIGVNTKDGIYTKEAFALIHELTQFFEELEAIDEDDVISITNIKDMQGRNGELIIEPLLEEDEIETLDEASIAQVREKIRSNDLYRGKLVSLDEKSAVVLAGVPTKIGLEEASIMALKETTLAKLNDLRQRYPQITLDFSGPAMLKAFVSEYMQKDLKTLFPLAIATVALLILLLLRSFLGMLAPVMVVLFSVVWTFGLKALLNSPITIVETAIPVVLIAIGCADGIHILSEFLNLKRKGIPVPNAVKKTMNLMALPVILTSITTAMGFLSLITAPGVSIRNMGIFLAFGVMIAMIYSLLLIPSYLSYFRGQKTNASEKATETLALVQDHRMSSFEVGVNDFLKWLIRRKRGVMIVFLLLLGLAVFGVLNVEVESDEVRYLKKDNEFRLATENIQHSLGGITSLDIVITGTEKDLMKQPSMLKAIEELQRFCETDSLVSYSLSLADLVKRINYVLHDNTAEFDRIPNDQEEIKRIIARQVEGRTVTTEQVETVSGQLQVAQYLLLYEMSGGDTTEQYVDPEYKMAKITVRLKDMSSQRLKELLEKLEPYIRQHFPETVTARYANHYIRVVMMDLIIDSQIFSLITVLIAITILMSIIFRSPVIGIFTSLPVFIAVLLNFTLMWAFNVTLNIGTSIIASVGMGVGIDYAIHYFSRFKFLLKASGDYETSVLRATTQTSRAILFNATAVGIGFLVLLFSEYGVIANIGWITTVSMFTTAFGSLIVLPVLLTIFKPKVPGTTNENSHV